MRSEVATVVIIHRGELYLNREHIEPLRSEPEYVQQRYRTIASFLAPDSVISKRKAAKSLGLKPRQFNRILKRFEKEGISGLRYRSRCPHSSPNKTPDWLEEMVVNVRKRTGFGPFHLAEIINKNLELNGLPIHLNKTTVYRILVRRGIIEVERRAKAKWRRFEWGHPNRLIQADLTYYNGFPILTTEDDHSRKGWALRLKNAEDKTVVRGLKKLHKMRYDNLLTDNGGQFSRKNRVMKEYCEEYIDEKHIWTSIHHPQTMGKLSAFQKGLKGFLFYTVGESQDRKLIDHCISVYLSWYNNGRYHVGIENYPEVRYSGQRDEEWFETLVEGLKLEEILTLPDGPERTYLM